MGVLISNECWQVCKKEKEHRRFYITRIPCLTFDNRNMIIEFHEIKHINPVHVIQTSPLHFFLETNLINFLKWNLVSVLQGSYIQARLILPFSQDIHLGRSLKTLTKQLLLPDRLVLVIENPSASLDVWLFLSIDRQIRIKSVRKSIKCKIKTPCFSYHPKIAKLNIRGCYKSTC